MHFLNFPRAPELCASAPLFPVAPDIREAECAADSSLSLSRRGCCRRAACGAISTGGGRGRKRGTKREREQAGALAIDGAVTSRGAEAASPWWPPTDPAAFSLSLSIPSPRKPARLAYIYTRITAAVASSLGKGVCVYIYMYTCVAALSRRGWNFIKFHFRLHLLILYLVLWHIALAGLRPYPSLPSLSLILSLSLARPRERLFY